MGRINAIRVFHTVMRIPLFKIQLLLFTKQLISKKEKLCKHQEEVIKII